MAEDRSFPVSEDEVSALFIDTVSHCTVKPHLEAVRCNTSRNPTLPVAKAIDGFTYSGHACKLCLDLCYEGKDGLVICSSQLARKLLKRPDV